MMKIRIMLILFLLFLLLASNSWATTYYAGPSGSGTTCSDSVPCSLATALGNLNTGSGHTVVLKDGTYGQIGNPTSGTSGAYNIIKAQNDGGAICTVSSIGGTSGVPLYLPGSYIQIEGIKFVANGAFQSGYLPAGSGHNKILRCAFVSGYSLDTGSNFGTVEISGTYNLFEDCWAWGGGRYKFITYGGNSETGDEGNYNIFRRCVARHDKDNSALGQATFTNYSGRNNIFQNCISIDSDQDTYYNANYWHGGFFLEKGYSGNDSSNIGPITIRGSIVLNNSAPALFESNAYLYNSLARTATVTNSVAWDTGGGFIFDYYSPSTHAEILDSCTLGVVNGWAGESGMNYGFRAGVSSSSTGSSSTDTIYYDMDGGLWDVGGTNTNNLFYNVTTLMGGGSTSSGNVTENPLTSRLHYIPRVESGTIGATIMYKWGTSGTIYGETGYDTVTTDPLWPWPNEARIKTDMSGYPSSWGTATPNPVRGFTSTGTQLDGSTPITLTSYIWEYLGNEIPADIYGEENDTTAPTITAFDMPATASSLTVNVTSFTATDDVGVTGYCITTVNSSAGCSWSGSAPTTATGVAGANTFYAWARDAALNVSSASTDTTTITLPECSYYVRPDGNNANTGTANTSGGAWLTLQKAADTLVAGETVCVADGTYAGFNETTDGTSGARITYKASGTSANITTHGPTRNDGINLEGADYITIDGFNVYNQPERGIRAVNGSGIIIQNCTVYDNGYDGILSGFTPSIQVLNNIVHDNGTTALQHNLYLSNATTDNCVVRGNTVYASNSGNGVQLNGDWQEGGDGFMDNCVIEDNIVYGNYQKGFSLISIRYATIRNNIIYGNGVSSGAGGIHIVEQLGQNYSIDNVVVNNTIDEPTIATVRINSGNTGNVVFNNVSIGSTGIVFEGSGNYSSNNLTTTTGFTNRTNHDYSLTAGSDKIDAGLATYQSEVPPTDDISGLSRPQNSLYDVGAYEFEDSAEPPAPTAVATGTQFSGCSIN